MTIAWEVRALGDICEIARGGSPRPIQEFITNDPNGVSWIKISDATASGKYIYSTKEKITQAGVQRSRMVNEGDFILSNSMSFGRPYIMKTSGCIHDGWLVLSDKKHVFDQDYLYYFLGSDIAYRQFDSLAAGSTVRNLNIESAKKVKVPLPPIAEQKRIAAILDEAFAGIAAATANAEKNLANARELFDLSLEAIFTKEGNGWVQRPFSDICEITSKLVDPREPRFIDLPHLGAGNMVSKTGELIEIKTAREEELKSGKFLFDESMVLYSKIRPYLMKACRPDFSGLCSADVYPLFPKPALLNRNFLFYLLLSRKFTEFAIGGSDRAGMPKVNRDHLFSYKAWLPDVKEQRLLASKLDEISSETNRIELIYQRKISALAELKQAILQKAFSGDLTGIKTRHCEAA